MIYSQSPGMSDSSLNRLLIVDRDGTLIVEKEYLADPNGVELIPGAADTLKKFAQAGWKIAVVTNQSGVGRGMFTMAEVEAVNSRISELLLDAGVHVDGWFICADHPDLASTRRKPSPGMGFEAARDLGGDLSRSIVVGDKDSDLEFARALGARAVLVRSGYGSKATAPADVTLDSLAELLPDHGEGLNWKGDRYKSHFEEAISTFSKAKADCRTAVLGASSLLAHVYRQGGKLLLCGNGGSAADCQHIAAELVCRLSSSLERPSLPAISLSTDTSILTAWSNDYTFDTVFARQVDGLGAPGDALLAISTSGYSKSILLAAEKAKEKGMFVIASGGTGGELAKIADIAIEVPAPTTMRVQEVQLLTYHILCDLIEQELFVPRES